MVDISLSNSSAYGFNFGLTARESEAAARADNATTKLDMQLSAEQGTKAVTVAEGAALPAGYREGSSAGSGFAETANLPDGYRRVINTKTGNTEVLSTDGTLYLETADGLKPKAGGSLDGLVEAENRISGAKATVSSPLKLGETKVINDVNMTRVGRWMSPDELA